MILYGMRPSPYVRKVLMHAAEKGIALDVRPAGFGQGGEDFAAASPFRKMPALIDGDFRISDSSAIITYMEALYPEPSLMPTDAKGKARAVWFEEFGDTIVMPVVGKIFYHRVVAALLGQIGDPAIADAAEADELPPVLDYLEGILPESGYLLEDRFTLADIAVASPIINLGVCSTVLANRRWPRVSAWLEGIKARPAIAPLLAEEARQMMPQPA